MTRENKGPENFGEHELNQMFSGFFGETSPNRDETFERLVEVGFEHVDRGDWGSAIDQFSKAITMNPENAIGYSHRARCYWAAGDLEATLNDLQTAVRLDPKDTERQLSLGEVHCQLGNHSIAVRLLDRIRQQIESGDESFDRLLKERLYNHLAISQFEISETDAALKHVNLALANTPSTDQSRLLDLRGTIRAEKGEFTEALADLNKAISQNKSDYQLYLTRAEILKSLGKEDLVERDLVVAAALIPEDADLLFEAGERMLSLDPRRAEAWFSKVIELEPTYQEAWVMRACCSRDAAPDAALTDIDTALALNANHAYAHVLKGEILLTLNQTNSAIESLQRGCELEPRNANYHAALGFALLDIRKYEDSLTRFELALKLDPECTSAYAGRGTLIAELGDDVAARQDAEKALSIDSNFAPAFYLLGQIALDNEDWKQAIVAFQRSLSDTDQRESALAFLAYSQLKNGEGRSAIETIRQTEQTRKNDADVDYVLSEIYRAAGQLEKALMHIRNAIENSQSNARYFQQLGLIHMDSSEPQMARDALNQALKLEPSRKRRERIKALLAK
jgi:tetratricopeptide (TPR) repeat protein